MLRLICEMHTGDIPPPSVPARAVARLFATRYAEAITQQYGPPLVQGQRWDHHFCRSRVAVPGQRIVQKPTTLYRFWSSLITSRRAQGVVANLISHVASMKVPQEDLLAELCRIGSKWKIVPTLRDTRKSSEQDTPRHKHWSRLVHEDVPGGTLWWEALDIACRIASSSGEYVPKEISLIPYWTAAPWQVKLMELLYNIEKHQRPVALATTLLYHAIGLSQRDHPGQRYYVPFHKLHRLVAEVGLDISRLVHLKILECNPQEHQETFCHIVPDANLPSRIRHIVDPTRTEEAVEAGNLLEFSIERQSGRSAEGERPLPSAEELREEDRRNDPERPGTLAPSSSGFLDHQGDTESEEGEILALATRRRAQSRSPISDAAQDLHNTSLGRKRVVRWRQEGCKARRFYSHLEDNAIIHHVYTSAMVLPHTIQLGGNYFWQDMVQKQVCPDRTWHSLRERWRKYLMWHLGDFLSRTEMQNLKDNIKSGYATSEAGDRDEETQQGMQD